MKQFWLAVLPRDLISEVLLYSTEPLFFENKVFSSYEYVMSILTGDTKKDNYLRLSMEEVNELEMKKSRIAELRTHGTKLDIIRMEELTELRAYVDMSRDLIKTIVRTDNINMLKYLHSAGKLPHRVALSHNMLNDACSYGSLGVLKHVIKIINPTRENSVYNIGWAIQCAGENGHLKIIEFLVKLLKLTREDGVRLDIIRIYRQVCFKGQIKILEYLERIFEPSVHDLKIEAMLKRVIAMDDIKMMSHLITTHNLTRVANGLFKVNDIYRNALDRSRSDTKMSLYIRETFGMTPLTPAQT